MMWIFCSVFAFLLFSSCLSAEFFFLIESSKSQPMWCVEISTLQTYILSDTVRMCVALPAKGGKDDKFNVLSSLVFPFHMFRECFFFLFIWCAQWICWPGVRARCARAFACHTHSVYVCKDSAFVCSGSMFAHYRSFASHFIRIR